MQEGTNDLPNNLKTSLKDVQLYLNVTRREIIQLLDNNYRELEISLNKILQTSGQMVTEKLAEYSHAVSLTNLNNIVSRISEIRVDLNKIKDTTQGLRTNATQLDIGNDYY